MNNIEYIDLLERTNTAEIWLIKDKSGDKYYALKRIERSKIRNNTQIAQILNEKKHLESLSNIIWVVKLYRTFRDQTYLYYIEECIDGGDLSLQLKHFGCFQECTMKYYAVQLIEALKVIHHAGYIHGDLKLKNVLITTSGHVRIVDWACSIDINSDKKDKLQKFGTVHYMCPEMIKASREFKYSSIDWWCLGIMLYWMIVGEPPFWDANESKLEAMILNKQAPVIRQPCSNDCKDFIMKLLDKDPFKRSDDDNVKQHVWLKDVDWLSIQNIDIGLVPIQFNANLGVDLTTTSNENDAFFDF